MYYDILNSIKDYLQLLIITAMVFIFVFNHGYKMISLIVGGIALVSMIAISNSNAWDSNVVIAGRLDLLTAILLIALLKIKLTDSAKGLAKKQAALLFFATIAHTMVKLAAMQGNDSSLFYLYYDELIILIGIIQLGICHGAILESFRNLRRFVHSSFFVLLGYNSSISQRNKTESRK